MVIIEEDIISQNVNIIMNIGYIIIVIKQIKKKIC
jgi:hypothetical protein